MLPALKTRRRFGLSQLTIYLFRQMMVAFIFASAAVTFVILFTQSFRLLALVIDNSSTMWFFFRLLALSIPTFLPLVLPLGLGVAVLFVYHKLAVDSELVVMRAVGVSPMHQAMPALLLATTVVIFCYILTLWLGPTSSRNLVKIQYNMRDNVSMLLSRPGNFNDITDGVTFYARERGSGGAIEGILMHDVRKPEMPITIMAERGQVVNNNGQPQLIIFNGKRQEMNTETGQLAQLAFDQYVLDYDGLRSENAGHRLPDPREQTMHQLLNPTDEMIAQRSTQNRLTAELHQRFTMPLLAMTYTFIGLIAMLAGEFNRRGMGKRILAAAAAIITLQVLVMSLISMIARQGSILAILLYFVAIAPTLIGIVLLNRERFDRFRFRRRAALP